MKRLLKILAASIALATILTWVTLGANRSWTKTEALIKKTDEVTGIEGISYVKKFDPGVDFLGLGLLGAGVLAGAQIFTGSKSSKNTNNQ